MSTKVATRLRTLLAATALAPALGVALVASTATPGSAADADITLTGGAASSAVVCGNVAEAQQLAAQRHIPLQRSRCTAAANGGDVALDGVEIFLPRGPGGGDNDTLARFAGGRASGADVATDTCAVHQPSSGPGTQINVCTAAAQSGLDVLDHVTLVNHLTDGRTTQQVVGRLAVAPSGSGSVSATCRNVVSDPLHQRDDCDGTAPGGSWFLHDVDVVTHNSDGTSATRRGIDVTVRGGDATASTYCFNTTDGASRVVQVNICRATAQAGTATLRNVTINAYSD